MQIAELIKTLKNVTYFAKKITFLDNYWIILVGKIIGELDLLNWFCTL